MRTAPEFIRKAAMLGCQNDLTPNIARLERLANHIDGLDRSQFSNRCYRSKGSYKSKEPSRGCIADAIGHSTAIASDDELRPFRNKENEIIFAHFVEKYFGIRYMSNEWLFLFDSNWEKIDDTPAYCAVRIRMIIEKYKRHARQIV